MNSVDIVLLGRTYSVSCPEGKEHVLEEVVKTLQYEIKLLEKKPGVSQSDITMLAALNISHELYNKTLALKELEQKIDKLEQKVTLALNECQPVVPAPKAQPVPNFTESSAYRAADE